MLEIMMKINKHFYSMCQCELDFFFKLYMSELGVKGTLKVILSVCLWLNFKLSMPDSNEYYTILLFCLKHIECRD